MNSGFTRLLYQNGKTLLPLVMMSWFVTAIVLLVDSLGSLELLELHVFDWQQRSRPLALRDDRLLVVGIQERDLKTYGVPLPDQVLARVLHRLQTGGAKVIGLDLYRDIPQPPGTSDLYQQLQVPNLVGIVQLGQARGEWIGPPPFLPAEQIGFNDLLLDPDSVIRRGLLFATDGNQVYQSFAFRLARFYLADQNIQPQTLEHPREGIAWGETILTPLPSFAGGYARLDDRGYQILLDYRSLDTVAPIITVQDLLQGTVSPDLIRDRIVLIGTLAPSQKDIFLTPYSWLDRDSSGIAGVLIHAHFTQQLLDLALGKRSPLYGVSPILEILWLACWTLVGGLMAYRRHPLWRSVLETSTSVAMLWGIQFSLLRFSVWIPVVAPSLGIGLGLVMGLGHSRYRLWRLHQSLLSQVQQQSDAIAALQTLQRQPPAPQYAIPQDAITTLPEGEDLHLAALVTPETNPDHKTLQQYAITTLPEGEVIDRFGLQETTLKDTALENTDLEDSELVDTVGIPGEESSPSAPHVVSLPQWGQVGGRYCIYQVLGKGGFGVTYLARDQQRPGQPSCVIKRLSPTRQDPQFLEAAQRLFRLEAQILESLGREHDRIPQLLAYFEADQEFYLVQDFVEGHSFCEELRQGVTFSIAAVLDLLLDILPTLDFIHRHNLIHRDLKPSNLIRRKDGAFVVIDFGAVKHFSDVSQGKTLALGTPGYMSPEQLAGFPRLNSDLYSLGIIAIQCLVATPPQGWTIDPETGILLWQPLVQSQQKHDAHDTHNAQLDEFIALLSRLVAWNASDRYPSAAEALKAFKKFKKSWSTSTVT